ncbi:hypothetical protein [Saccharothrix texasensis]|uniref:hypothetical protein n=1 Tax=Saccharothrix texasensis TaxID=103734 RepID=UPI000F4AFEBB|nr:hypothetical protein [Saccharothrix texasensis]
MRYYRQALALRRSLGNDYDAASTLGHLGSPHAALGEHDHARAAWREALVMCRQQGRESDAEEVLRQLDALDHARTPTSAGTPPPAHCVAPAPAPTTSAGSWGSRG